MRTLPLKEVPVEVDLGVEALGYTPDYSRFGNTTEGFDIRRIGIMVEGHQVAGIVDGGKMFIEAVLLPDVAS